MGATAPKEYEIEKIIMSSIPSSKNVKKHEDYIEYLVIFQCVNALLQFIVDVILEILTQQNIIPYHDIRLLYALLAGTVAFISFKTLDSIRKNQFTIVYENAQLGFLLEAILIIGDLWFLYGQDYQDLLIYRIWFLGLTFINIVIIFHIIIKFKLYSIYYMGSI